MISILSSARNKLFQLEIGVQSTNNNTLNYIKRKTNIEDIFSKVLKIKSFKNIHQHLDLIAGLPGENMESFKKSFNDVYNLYPDQLQLGFLKLLKGSGLRNDAFKYGIVYKDKSPYEVLFTKDLTYDEIIKLKNIEEMVEIYYNSGKCLYTLRYIINFFNSPFDFFYKLSIYWNENKYNTVQHNKMKLYTIMFEFCTDYTDNIEKLKDIIKFDMFLNDNIKSFPQWLEYIEDENYKKNIKIFFNNLDNINKYVPELKNYTGKQIARMCHIEKFKYNIINWINSDFKNLNKEDSYILFNYYSCENVYTDIYF